LLEVGDVDGDADHPVARPRTVLNGPIPRLEDPTFDLPGDRPSDVLGDPCSGEGVEGGLADEVADVEFEALQSSALREREHPLLVQGEQHGRCVIDYRS
jgi:hypothetical protein